MDALTAAVIILAVLVVLLFAAGAGLYRRVRELELATYNGVGLRLGGTAAGAGSRSIAAAGQTTIILKINRRCPICDELLERVHSVAPDLPEEVQLVVLSDDPSFDRVLPRGVRLITDPATWREVTVPYVPALLVVDEQGIVTYSTPAGSVNALDAVVGQLRTQRKEVER